MTRPNEECSARFRKVTDSGKHCSEDKIHAASILLSARMDSSTVECVGKSHPCEETCAVSHYQICTIIPSPQAKSFILFWLLHHVVMQRRYSAQYVYKEQNQPLQQLSGLALLTKNCC